jgi:hypothetical protein
MVHLLVPNPPFVTAAHMAPGKKTRCGHLTHPITAITFLSAMLVSRALKRGGIGTWRAGNHTRYFLRLDGLVLTRQPEDPGEKRNREKANHELIHIRADFALDTDSSLRWSQLLPAAATWSSATAWLSTPQDAGLGAEIRREPKGYGTNNPTA